MANKIYDNIKNFIKNNYKGLIIIALVIFLSWYEFPYIVYKPGGIVSLEKRIEIDGGYSYDGSINMSYVSVAKGTVPMILLSYVFPNWDLESRSAITNDNTLSDTMKLERLYMASSIDNAIMLAYKEAGKDVFITRTINNITYITKEAKTDLQVYDELLSVDELVIHDINELKKYINTLSAGDKVSIKVLRNNELTDCYAYIYETNDGLKMGITFLNTYEYDTNPKINISTKSSESGSSGGLMLSLAIYNKLISEDITRGKKIVGTGTIDQDGNVGKIDGIKYKLLGAEKSNADAYLCPKDNYEEALKVKEELKLKINIYSVQTFQDALDILKSIN